MFQIFRRSLQTGTVTRSYPGTPDPAPPGFRGKPELRADACEGEGACAAVCPASAITIERDRRERVWQIDYGRCVNCGWCEEACPNGAIVLTTEYELTARSREALYRRVVFPASTERGDDRDRGSRVLEGVS